MLGVSVPALAVLVVVLLVSATVQGLIGLGLGLISAPVATLVAPHAMPELLLWLAMLLPAITLLGERRHIDWRLLGFALPMRVPGTLLGVLAVGLVSTRLLGLFVALMVLASVALTFRAVSVSTTPTSMLGAGLLSGFAGTVTSIGGPPIAVLIQHKPAREVRPTLAVFFLAGAAISLIGLGIGGHLEARTALLSLCLAPTLVVGVLVARPLRSRVADDRVRGAVLVLCTASALILLVRSLLG